jgi:hypothetical protein
MGVNHGGDESPQNLQWGTLIQVVPPDFGHFSKFQALAMDSSPPPPRFQPRSTPLFKNKRFIFGQTATEGTIVFIRDHAMSSMVLLYWTYIDIILSDSKYLAEKAPR